MYQFYANKSLGCIIRFFSSNRKRFPKLPGLVGYICQFLAIVSLLLPKCYLQTLIVLNDGNTLVFGVLLALEFGVILLCNKIFYGAFGGMYDLTHCLGLDLNGLLTRRNF